jgi:5-methyltetrahydropteroyltriglutamate--homocysteine methyltransferase
MIRTTVVGSWPIPFGLKPKLTQYYRSVLSDEAAHDVLQAAARIAMDEQRACGLDQIMGGEVFAPDFVHHVPARLTGLEIVQRRDHRAGLEGMGRYRIVGDITAPRGTGHSLAYRREQAIEPELDKAAVPSVRTMTLPFVLDPHLDAQLENVARLVDAEVRDMVAAGVREIQLDAPLEAAALVMRLRTVEDIAPWLARPFGAVANVRRTVHFCLGDMGRRPGTPEQHLRTLIPLIQALAGRIDRVHLECSHPGQWAEIELLNEIPESMEVIAGIADVKSVTPASEAELRERIAALLRVLPAERLLVSSSCGCGRMPHDHAIELMGNLARAAHSL